MRNLSALALFASFIIFQSSCKVINGNHDVITETRSIGTFTKIRLSGFANVHLMQGKTEDLKISGESNIISRIRTRVEGDVLIIDTRNQFNFNTHEPVTIYVATPDIEKISVSGAGDLYGENKWELDKGVELHTSGAGKIKAELNSPEVEVSVSGAGDVMLAGETKDMKADISGAGKIKAENLKSENAEVEVSGAGDANVFASVFLKARVSGAGKINYWGNPQKVDSHESGAGDINKK
ncbi:MAG: DUF2807 domain-containing protein [Sphingobacteriales bacterium]|nr:DUF2807 domain-containing protein [Sphingobacteriales bacterium]